MKKRFHAYLLTGLLAVGGLFAGAQSVLKMPERLHHENDMQAGTEKQASIDSKQIAQNFADRFGLLSAADRQQIEAYVEETGSVPSLPKAPAMYAEGEDEKTWTYTGFNAYAGLKEDGTTKTGGLCLFNYSPEFECDTVSSHPGLSPYSYVKGNVLNCYLPIQSGGVYKQLKWTSYDATTLEELDSKTVDLPVQDMSYCPYIMVYEENHDAVYAISMKSGKNQDNVSYDEYYMNILDEETHQLKRLFTMGQYRTDRKSGNYVPKGFAGGSGNLFLLIYDGEKQFIERVMTHNLYNEPTDVLNSKFLKRIGETEIPSRYLLGLQPMIYDANSGKLIIMHYDMENGTIIYQQNTFAPYGVEPPVCACTALTEKLPTGFTFFYKRPVPDTSGKAQLDRPTDVEIIPDNDNRSITINFTLPNTVNGGQEIDETILPSSMNKKVRGYIYVDGNYAAATNPAQPEFGEAVTATVANMKPGPHTVTLNIGPMASSYIGGYYHTTLVNVGYDAPGDVVNPSLVIEDKKAVISWEAPTQGRFADFGVTYDPSDISYTVTRDLDGKVIAENITDTSCEDTDISELITNYVYTIKATSHENTNLGTQTPRVTYGEYLALPYSNEFNTVSDIYGWTVLNTNNDGTASTWVWNSYQTHVYCTGTKNADDWFISPAFKMEKEKLYEISFDYAMGRYNQYNGWETASMKVTLGQGATPEDQDIELVDLDKVGTASQQMRLYFKPTEDGNYNLGFYDYGVGESYCMLDNLVVKEIATSEAPEKVRGLKLTPDANGALGATLSFTLPTTDITGNEISSLTGVTAYDLEGTVMASDTEVTPGKEISLSVTAVNDVNRYFVVAANDKGEGWPVEISKFIGPDVPKAVTDLKAVWGDEKNITEFTWTNPTEGVNGGYVNPKNFIYTLYRYDKSKWPPYIYLGETDSEDNSIEISIADMPEGQDQYPFALTAKNEKGESAYSLIGIVMGDPYTLPFVDPFREDGLDHQPYIVTADENGSCWAIDALYYNADVVPYDYNVQLVAVNRSGEDGKTYFASPIIDFADAQAPVFDLWLHHTPNMPEDSYFQVMASLDGSRDYTPVCEPVKLTGNNGWQMHRFDLSPLKGKKAQVAIFAYMSDPTARIFADSWNIHEATGNDLAVTGISQPAFPKAGDTVEVKVTVANLGSTTASNFSVMFNLNDDTVEETDAPKALAMGESTEFTFSFKVAPDQESYIYGAEIVYADDNKENNLSTEVEIFPAQFDLPAPTELRFADNSKTLTWNAPEEAAAKQVVMDFEDMPAFLVDNIGDWKNIDLDGNKSMTFVLYYDNPWPYANRQKAWMTWSNREAGFPDATMWAPYEGSRCLIHWGNYLLDEEGRLNEKDDNDWFISPEIVGGTDFSFYTLANDLSCAIEVLTSSTTDDPEAFTTLQGIDYSETQTWKNYSMKLPADAKYVAIRTLHDGFGIMIDNIAYTPARVPQLQGYNIWKGSEFQQYLTDLTGTVETAGKYYVNAVYDLGQSAMSNSAELSGIARTLADGVAVNGGKNSLTVSGLTGQNVDIFNVNGMRVAKGTGLGSRTWNVEAGVYLVKVSGKTFKVLVK